MSTPAEPETSAEVQVPAAETFTPAEILRQAAAKLRETAALVAWEPDDEGGTWREFFIKHGADLGLWREPEAWIALMDPQIAEPLAAWLEAEAELAERLSAPGHIAATRQALATARTILGGAP